MPRPKLIGGQTPAIIQLRKLILEDWRPLTKLARTAGVSYESLWKFKTGRQQSYNLLDAERVYHSLTGKNFIEGGKPL